MTCGEPEELLGESGGTELLQADLGLELVTDTLNLSPDLALLTKDLTYIQKGKSGKYNNLQLGIDKITKMLIM